MTKEELEKEAEEFTDTKKSFWRQGRTCIDSVKQAYIAGAELREKRIERLFALVQAERKRQEQCNDIHLRKIAELEKENAELKTVKIPQLERKIASIRGAHSVDCKKLKARLEQCERQKECIAELEKENAELKKTVEHYRKEREFFIGEVSE